MEVSQDIFKLCATLTGLKIPWSLVESVGTQKGREKNEWRQGYVISMQENSCPQEIASETVAKLERAGFIVLEATVTRGTDAFGYLWNKHTIRIKFC